MFEVSVMGDVTKNFLVKANTHEEAVQKVKNYLIDNQIVNETQLNSHDVYLYCVSHIDFQDDILEIEPKPLL